VISQMEWIAQRTPPPLRRALFDTLVPIFAKYSEAAVAIAVREGNKGVTALRLSLAVSKREYGSFARTLASRPGSSNPVITAAYHLKHSGVQHTAVLAGRYLRNTLHGGRLSRTLSRVAWLGRDRRQQDVMFGLMVIQQRLRGMDSRLGDLEGRLGDIEHQIVELGARPESRLGVDEQGRNGSPSLDRLKDPVRRS
jgi:hypothetical protein